MKSAMKPIFSCLLLFNILALYGCGNNGDGEAVALAQGPPANLQGDGGDKEVKTRVIRALLDALEEIDDVDSDERDMLRDLLIDADNDLQDVLAGNSIRLIQQANQRRPAFQVRPSRNRKNETEPSPQKAEGTDKASGKGTSENIKN